MDKIKTLGRDLFVLPLVHLIMRLNVPPNSITLFSLVFSVFVFFGYQRGVFWLAGILLLLGSICDTLDGEIARQTNRTSIFGGFLDSTVDRINEFAVYLGLFFYYYNRAPYVIFWILFALFGSLMVSYTRARAEGLGISPRVGIFERFVRLTFLIIGSFLGPKFMVYFLAIIAIGSLQTTIHRILFVYHNSSK
ncbi:MAG: CDP-alcohol phosphatidyltransferase family protein [candidate division WOR-3 bacterium]